MATRNFVLTDHSASLMEQGESEDAARLAVLRKAAQQGIADIDAGHGCQSAHCQMSPAVDIG